MSVRPVLLVAVLCGCSQEMQPAAIPDGDPVLFAAEVQPVLRRHCAFLGCHGREGMSLTLYAVDHLRLRDPTGDVDFDRPPLDERALSPAELGHNRRAIAARAGADDPGGRRFLRRLIPMERGGILHANVVVFEREDDPDLAALRHFLETVDAQ